MKSKTLLCITIASFFICFSNLAQELLSPKSGNFNIDKDLLLAHFDCKTDVDDLQTVAVLATLISNTKYSQINHHAVAGAYGIQEGLYAPPNDLFQLAFGNNWTDAHENIRTAVEKVKVIALAALKNQGDIWIAEAGQSDFSAKLINVIQSVLPGMTTSQRIQIVQHCDWSEEVTSPASLDFVKKNIDYHKIPDGNGVGNGTPGFRSPNYDRWQDKIQN